MPQNNIIRDYKGIVLSCVILLTGLFFEGQFLLKDKVKSKSDLVEIKAALHDYSFTVEKGTNSHALRSSSYLKYKYYLHLNGFGNDFQIIADFLDNFNRDSFEEEVHYGDVITVLISKKDFKNIDKDKNTRIFGISNNKITFLDYDLSIQIYNKETELYGGIIFIVIGTIFMYFSLSQLQKHKNSLSPQRIL
jgi:hypothetical protein